MGKATIISGGDEGLYQIQINILKDKAESRIESLQAEIDKIESGDDIVFSPPLATQAADLETLIHAYQQGIEDNRNAEESERLLQKQLAYEQAKLDDLEAELSDLEADRDQKQSDYTNAQDQFDAGEITQEELDWWESRYLAAEAAVLVKQSAVNTQQAVVNGVQAQINALDYAELAKQLEQIKADSDTFLTWDPAEPLPQLDAHLSLAESILTLMAGAFNSAIQWYNDAISANLEDQQNHIDLQAEQAPITTKVNEYSGEVSIARAALDSANADYETAYVQYLRGEITEAELQPYIDARDAAAAEYAAAMLSYTYWYDQWDALEVQKNQCVHVGTEPMYERMNSTATAYEQMSQDVGALRTFRNRQELKKTALEKELERLERLIDEGERTQSAWCADLTEDLTADAEVGTIEIKGESEQILVQPGYGGNAVYDQDRDGQLMPAGLATPAQSFYNYAMLPGWQKWAPTYRVGKIKDLDGDNCTVILDSARSAAQALDINQATELTDVPIRYMNCNGRAFEVGDRIVVEFEGQEWDNPKVIGFEEEPQKCDSEFLTVRVTGEGVDLGFVWDIAENNYAVIEGIEEWPCQWSSITGSDWFAGMESVGDRAAGSLHGYQDALIDSDVLCTDEISCINRDPHVPGEQSCSKSYTSFYALGYDYAGVALWNDYNEVLTNNCELVSPDSPALWTQASDLTQVLDHLNIRFESGYLWLSYQKPNMGEVYTLDINQSPPVSTVHLLQLGKAIITNLQQRRYNRVAWEKDTPVSLAWMTEESTISHYLNNPLTGKHLLFECKHEFAARSGYYNESIVGGKAVNVVLMGFHSVCVLIWYDLLKERREYYDYHVGPPEAYNFTSSIKTPRYLAGVCSASVVQDWDLYDPIQDQQSVALLAAVELMIDTWYVQAGVIMSERIGNYTVGLDILTAALSGEE